MSKIGVSLKIAVNKIDKERLFKGKNTYLDCTAFIDLDSFDEYGNSGMITQDVSKEEREQGVQGAILGNTKVFWKGEGQARSNTQQQSQQQSQPAQQSYQNDFDEDSIPFD